MEGQPQWSRKRLARELCQQWQWGDGQGRLKDFAARSLLLKLAARGQVKLPPLQRQQRRPPRGAPTLESWEEPVAWEASLAEISPIRLERAEGALNRLQPIAQEVWAVGREWTRALLEKRLQAECLAVEMVSAQTGEELENTRWRSMGLDPVVGKGSLKVRHGDCAEEEAWVCPTRQAWGLKPYERKTPEWRARLAATATVAGSYAEAEKRATLGNAGQ